MKYILIALTLVLALSTSAVSAQNADDQKIMSKLNAGGYTGKHFSKGGKKPLVILHDGASYYKADFNKIQDALKPEWIDVVEVMKPPKAVQEYGEEANNGVILITLKQEMTEVKQYLDTLKGKEN